MRCDAPNGHKTMKVDLERSRRLHALVSQRSHGRPERCGRQAGPFRQQESLRQLRALSGNCYKVPFKDEFGTGQWSLKYVRGAGANVSDPPTDGDLPGDSGGAL